MAEVAESSSISSKNDKPVIVRVKRKASQIRLDAFWLEINERPFKRPLLDFGKLSISESSNNIVEELKTRKVLVCHVETVTSSRVTFDVLQSLVPSSNDAFELGNKNKEIRRTFRTEDKQDQLLAKAKQSQESLSRNARFEQIWRSRKEKKETMPDEALGEMCRLYDVVRVDVEEKITEVHHEDKRDVELDDHRMMSQYLPLLKEVLPSAAVEIESDIHDYISRQGASSDGYVYDIYAVKDDMDISEEGVTSSLPLVQVDDDDDFYDGPDESEYETDDSNAENNPLNEYPDEEETEDEDVDSRTSDDQLKIESRSDDQSGEAESEPEDVRRHDWSDHGYAFSDDGFDVDDDGEGYDFDYDYGDNYSDEGEWM